MADENQALTADDIKSLLGEALGTLRTELSEEINRTVTGATTKLKKSQDTAMSEMIKTQLSTFVEGISNPTAPVDPTPTEGQPPAPSPVDSADPMAKFQAAMDAKLAEQQKLFQQQQQAMQKELQAARESAEKERLTTAMTKAEGDLFTALQGKVNNPIALLATLERQGQVSYSAEHGTYGFKGQDEFQNPTFTPLADKVPELLKNPDYAWVVPPRPGSGLGSAPSSGSDQQQGKGQGLYSPESQVSAPDRFDAMKRSQVQAGEDFYDLLGKQVG